MQYNKLGTKAYPNTEIRKSTDGETDLQAFFFILVEQLSTSIVHKILKLWNFALSLIKA